jgi:hypothetical protein
VVDHPAQLKALAYTQRIIPKLALISATLNAGIAFHTYYKVKAFFFEVVEKV